MDEAKSRAARLQGAGAALRHSRAILIFSVALGRTKNARAKSQFGLKTYRTPVAVAPLKESLRRVYMFSVQAGFRWAAKFKYRPFQFSYLIRKSMLRQQS